MTYRYTRRMAALPLLAVLLAFLPSAPSARADEPVPAAFVVVGVAGATLRAEPDGASAALAIVPAGRSVTPAGPAVAANGVLWRQVRTAEGAVGYIPAGLLVQTQGAPIANDVLPSAPEAGSESPPPLSTASTSAVVDDGAVGSTVRQPAPSPVSTPTPPTRRTTVERRRGQDVTITHIDKEPAPNGQPMGAGRIVVGFRPGASQPARADAHRAAGASAADVARLPDVMVAQVSPGTVEQALAAYRARPEVAFAEPDYVRRALVTPNDPLFGSQWALQKINAPAAWEVTTGNAQTRVAILDCGVYTESSSFSAPDGLKGHPDIRGKVVAEANFSDALTGADDFCDHGTLMAGVAGASTNNGIGIAGVGFNVSLLNGKVLDDNGEGFDSWIANGIVWATNNGARVINLSLGGPGPCSATLQSAIDYAWNGGAVIVAAAGNGGDDDVGDPMAEAPGNCNHVIAVGAVNQSDARASFSNFGLGVDLAAPGVEILSTDFVGGYSTVTGTSPATPYVAGVAGLLWSTSYGSSNEAIVSRLLSTADPIAGTGTIWTNGRLNAAAAVAGSSPPPPPVDCSPRPQVIVNATPTGSALNVSISVTGSGNQLLAVQIGPAAAGAPTNAAVTFPGPADDDGANKTYVPPASSTSATFQVHRQAGGQPTTVPFVVTDRCGAWKSFVGGGPAAGF